MAAPVQRILVPTDFSDPARTAFHVALDLADLFSAEIHLLHVRVLLEDPHSEEEYRRELDRLMTREDQRTRELLSSTGRAGEAVVHPHLVRGLSEAEAICETVADLGCDLVVMGTHGRRGLKHLLLGSVTERVVQSCPVPVLTVHPGHTGATFRRSRILVPTDFSEASEAAMETASSWAVPLEAGVTLLHVIEPVVYPEFYAVDIFPEDIMERVTTRSQQALEKLAHDHFPDLPCETRVVTGRASEAILEEADPSRYSMLILASRGLSPIEHLLLGSVANTVVRRAKVPVLTLRSGSQE